MTTLFLLGLALGFDSFRVSLGLGGLRLSRARRRLIALSFGVCDGLAPLAGLLLGQSLVATVGRWTEYIAPFALGGYGLYVIYVACRRGESEQEAEGAWVVLGLPLALSLDNFAAGVGLGLLQYPALLSAAIIGADERPHVARRPSSRRSARAPPPLQRRPRRRRRARHPRARRRAGRSLTIPFHHLINFPDDNST